MDIIKKNRAAVLSVVFGILTIVLWFFGLPPLFAILIPLVGIDFAKKGKDSEKANIAKIGKYINIIIIIIQIGLIIYDSIKYII